MLRALLLLAGALGAVAQSSTVFSRRGLGVSVLCQPSPPLEHCRVEKVSPNADNSRRTWKLEEVASPALVQPDGDQCGFSIQSEPASSSSGFRCLLRLQQQQQHPHQQVRKLVEVFKLIIQKSPNASAVYISSTGQLSTVGVRDRFPSNEEFAFRDNDIVTATCVFPELQLPDDMSWHLDEQEKARDVTHPGRMRRTKRDLFVNKKPKKSSSRVTCKNSWKMISCDITFRRNASEIMASVPSMRVECEFGDDVVLPRPAVNVSSPLTVAREGDTVTVLCRAESALKYCRIDYLAPNVGQALGTHARSWDLQENQPATPDGVRYAGGGLAKGECGFTVQRVTQAFNGQFRCVAGFSNRPDEGVGVFNISLPGGTSMSVTPSETVALEGDRVTVLCRAGVALQYCRIEQLTPVAGDSRRWWYLHEDLPATPDGVRYAGGGLAKGQCGFTVQRVTHAFNGQFRCVAGLRNRTDEGVAAFNITVLDCSGSGESKDVCGSFTCQSYEFQCDNGACIDKHGLCNGIKQCADGSDEAIDRCGINITTLSTGCKLPPQPANGEYKLGGCDPPCRPVPGQFLDTAYLSYTCGPSSIMSGSPVVICDGVWSSAFPTCSQTCNALNFPSREIECKLNNKIVDCNQPMSPGTKASVKCNAFYVTLKELDDFVTTCRSDGTWSRQVLACSPKCGEPNVHGIPLVFLGQDAKNGEFPWHAGIYRIIDEKYLQVCGGNIITETTILTAAHCFWDTTLQEPVNIREYRIAVGKFYRDWNHPKERYFQTPEIENVVLHDKFRGSARNWADDIAIVKLKNMMVITLGVSPICVDYRMSYENFFLPGKNGVVMGWGITEKQTQSDTLRKATLPYVAFDICEKKVPESFVSILTYDKFCAGYENGTSVCSGDSGGGFAVKFRDGKYYLMGIVSIGVPSVDTNCNNLQYTTFTRLSIHYHFILDNIY